MNLCNECGRVNSHHAHCPNAEDIPSGWDECIGCGELTPDDERVDDGLCEACAWTPSD